MRATSQIKWWKVRLWTPAGWILRGDSTLWRAGDAGNCASTRHLKRCYVSVFLRISKEEKNTRLLPIVFKGLQKEEVSGPDDGSIDVLQQGPARCLPGWYKRTKGVTQLECKQEERVHPPFHCLQQSSLDTRLPHPPHIIFPLVRWYTVSPSSSSSQLVFP